MPFITNDIKRLLIGKRQYNQNATEYVGYVIVRKLFLSSETPLARDELSSIFDDYNDFESIDICENGIEGYVTFKTDIGAYIAWKEIEIEGVRIKPAYTWKQPKHKVAIDEKLDESDVETTFPLLDLCDKLLCDVMDRCDNNTLVNLSETCQRLEGVLQNYTYTRIDEKFWISVDDDECSPSPADAHKMLKLMGKHFQTLFLRFMYREKIDETDCDLIECFMHQAAKYCENIRQMRLIFRNVKTSLIEPLYSTNFQNLHTLQLFILAGQDAEVFDISLLKCPKLMTLVIGCQINITLSEPCSSLQNLTLTSTKCRDELFENTPELKKLKLIYVGDLFDGLSTRLPKVSKLTIDFRSKNDSLNRIGSLSNLKNLKILNFYFHNSEPLIEIAPVVPFLENLEKFKITVNDECKISDEIIANIITIVRKFPDLERFKLKSSELEPEQVSQLKQSLMYLKSLQLKGGEIQS